jgi:hypothetical protein
MTSIVCRKGLKNLSQNRKEGRPRARENCVRNSLGIGYYLRQDGSIRCKCTYKYSPEENLHLDAGSPVHYDRDGIPVPDAIEPIE